MNVGAGRDSSSRLAARRQEAAAAAERNAAEAAAEAARRAAEAPAPQKTKPAKKEMPPEVPVSVLRALDGHFSANNNALAWPDKAQSEELSGTHTLHGFDSGSNLCYFVCISKTNVGSARTTLHARDYYGCSKLTGLTLAAPVAAYVCLRRDVAVEQHARCRNSGDLHSYHRHRSSEAVPARRKPARAAAAAVRCEAGRAYA